MKCKYKKNCRKA